MIYHTLFALRINGVDDVVIVTGYKADVLNSLSLTFGSSVKFVHNAEFETTNMLQVAAATQTSLAHACSVQWLLQSLWMARGMLDRPFYVAYSDILFKAESPSPRPAPRRAAHVLLASVHRFPPSHFRHRIRPGFSSSLVCIELCATV